MFYYNSVCVRARWRIRERESGIKEVHFNRVTNIIFDRFNVNLFIPL